MLCQRHNSTFLQLLNCLYSYFQIDKLQVLLGTLMIPDIHCALEFYIQHCTELPVADKSALANILESDMYKLVLGYINWKSTGINWKLIFYQLPLQSEAQRTCRQHYRLVFEKITINGDIFLSS
jgi:hypothetical protein